MEHWENLEDLVNIIVFLMEKIDLMEGFIFLTNNFFLVIIGMCLLLKFWEIQNTRQKSLLYLLGLGVIPNNGNFKITVAQIRLKFILLAAT